MTTNQTMLNTVCHHGLPEILCAHCQASAGDKSSIDLLKHFNPRSRRRIKKLSASSSTPIVSASSN